MKTYYLDLDDLVVYDDPRYLPKGCNFSIHSNKLALQKCALKELMERSARYLRLYEANQKQLEKLTEELIYEFSCRPVPGDSSAAVSSEAPALGSNRPTRVRYIKRY